MDDIVLLRRYAESRSDEAFTELVQRHLNLVYSAALRQVGGDAHRAEDVAQMVFADLARKAPALRRHPTLVGWLYTSTHYTAAKLVRAESRRQIREQEAQTVKDALASPEPEVDWHQIRPVLDEAMHALSKGEREVVVLRFFDQRRMTEVGEELGLSESAARKRMDRALETLRRFLAKRGIGSTATALAVALEQHSVVAAPAGMATAISTSAFAGATGAASVATSLQLMSMTKVQIGFLGVLAASGIGLLGLSLNSMKPVETTTGSVAAGAVSSNPSGPAIPSAPAKDPTSASVYNADLATFIANLRATGRSERLIRAIANAAINERFRAREDALQPAHEPKNWWQYQSSRLSPEKSMALLDLKREKARLRRQLLGPDPDALAADETENPIAPEKRDMAKMIDEDYNVMIGTIRGSSGSLLLPAERAQIDLLKQERTRDYAALLDPEELNAWRLRTSQYAQTVSEALRFFEPTDQEFEMLYAHDKALKDPEAPWPRPALPKLEEEERAAMGEERWAEYDRSRLFQFQNLEELVIRSGLSRDVVIPVYDLWKAVNPETQRISNDAALSQEEKISALKQLGARTRGGIQQALGPEVAPAYLRKANAWISELEAGKVVTLYDSGWSSSIVSIQPPARPATAIRQ